MKIESDVFIDHDKIPTLYTCNGEGKQPPLKISGVVEKAESLALIVDDPDAPSGDFVHWIMWNISPETLRIENEIPPLGAIEGYTSLNKPGWVAPCPPSGIHHYNFKLYALDSTLFLPASSDKKALVQAMEGHILEESILIGLYGKN